jgi:hypothetical protein
MNCRSRNTMLLLATLMTGLTSHTEASTKLTQPLLRCEVTYAGSTHTIETTITSNPYLAPLHDIGGRFYFKAVMAGNGSKLDYIKLYAYLQGRDVDIPIHQASYKKPIHVSNAMKAITPINYLYAGEAERELQYQCFLGWSQK